MKSPKINIDPGIFLVAVIALVGVYVLRQIGSGGFFGLFPSSADVKREQQKAKEEFQRLLKTRDETIDIVSKSNAIPLQDIYRRYKGSIDRHVRKLADPRGDVFKKQLIVSTISRESSGRSNAIGQAGEVGLMQLTPIAVDDINAVLGKSFTMQELFDPDRNIEAGVLFYELQRRRFANKFGGVDTRVWIASYNAGFRGATELGRGREYADAVIEKMVILNQHGLT